MRFANCGLQIFIKSSYPLLRPPSPYYSPLLRRRLHEAVDVWGVSSRLQTYLQNKKQEKDRAARAAGSGSRNGWGIFGESPDAAGNMGGAAGKKGAKAAAGFDVGRRREEAERIRGQLNRLFESVQWGRVRDGPRRSRDVVDLPVVTGRCFSKYMRSLSFHEGVMLWCSRTKRRGFGTTSRDDSSCRPLTPYRSGFFTPHHVVQ